MVNLLVQYDEWRKRSNDAFFCLHSTPDGVEIADLSTLNIGEKVRLCHKCCSITSCLYFFQTHYIGFCDPSSREDFPGWGLRNLLFALSTIV